MDSRSDKRELSVLLLEPYFGGSHRSFLRGLMEKTPFEFTLMDMPARKWKWRMRLAAPILADEMTKDGRHYDRVLCSTFVDVAALRALGPSWLNDVPVLTYFHENQFAYPVQAEEERDMHFALTNMTTALATDSLAFNSQYNLDTFINGIRDLMRRAPDMKLESPDERILERSRVLSPGLDLSYIDIAPEPGSDHSPERPVVLWNHRWEHDKGPEEFFNALYELDSEGTDFSLIVLGEQFERQPAVFKEARERLGHRTLHFGYARERAEYARLMKLATVAVSTSLHEFFGISVIEAVRAGARPLLPRRLAYPGLFPDEFLYSEGELLSRLRGELQAPRRMTRQESLRLTKPHTWEALRQKYIDWIAEAERSA
jgi:glycosyltransferase involved in cell wall biosynthesis